MSDQSPPTTTPAGALSPDGNYRWDGSQWQAVQAVQPPPPPPAPVDTAAPLIPLPSEAKTRGHKGRKIAIGIVGLIVLFVIIAVASGGSKTTTTTQTTTSPGAGGTAAPAAAPVALTGTGSKVTNHFQLKGGSYKLVWTAIGRSSNFIVHIHHNGTKGLVNEIPPQPSSGEAAFDAPETGDYYLDVVASTLTWTITITTA